jgi:NAD(P)-dependent dehydrogenase (short-subunit alcohol dehydrogenase family)
MAVHPADSKKVVFISAITSDIGIALAKRYSRDGYVVTGTYRSQKLLPELKGLADSYIFYCDLTDKASIHRAIEEFAALGLKWETFISTAVWPLPLTKFFDSDFDEWAQSVHVNCIEQLRVLHELYPFRRTDIISQVAYFAGPATNNAVKNFSALAASKLFLIKMCELLDAENDDLNVFIVGPGWTKTKTHLQIMADPHVSAEKYKETEQFLATQEGTSMDDIYNCIRWLNEQGRSVAGGRNFSVVHDAWGEDELARALLRDPNMYKLRRSKNDWQSRGEHQP